MEQNWQKMLALLILLVGSTSVQSDSSASVVDNPCDGCVFKNGVGYNPYPGDCSKFIQCLDSGARFLVLHCPFYTGWNQIDLKCNLPCDNPHAVEEQCLLEPAPGNNTKYIQYHPFLPPRCISARKT